MFSRNHIWVLPVLLAAWLAGCKQQKAQTSSGPSAVPVSIAKATQETVAIRLRVVGTAEASSTVQVKSQVPGQLESVHFAEGQNVAKGALLFDIDARPYREALRQAEAGVARDQALLKQSQATLARDQAQLKNAEADAERYSQLSQAGVISKAQYDQVRTSAEVSRESVRAAQAAIESQRAALQSDLAAVEKAKLDLAYCRITAPISGRTGNLLVDAGNLVRANADTPMVVIHQVAPMFVSFSVPEHYLTQIRRLAANRKLPVMVSLQEEPERTESGHVSVIDNTVDSATGTIRLKAVFANGSGLLWPGQFVNVALTLNTVQDAVVVPSEAVQSGQQGQFVYVAKGDGTVEPRLVTAGQAFGRRIIIEKGVSAGDSIITDGHLRLYPGARIQVVEASKVESEKL